MEIETGKPFVKPCLYLVMTFHQIKHDFLSQTQEIFKFPAMLMYLLRLKVKTYKDKSFSLSLSLIEMIISSRNEDLEQLIDMQKYSQ